MSDVANCSEDDLNMSSKENILRVVCEFCREPAEAAVQVGFVGTNN